ncbi:hypothetical protein M8J77_026170 [Diaphorina citri]|nr:hypothetical protein M8J77_026170 [Diaphorina citri]
MFSTSRSATNHVMPATNAQSSLYKKLCNLRIMMTYSLLKYPRFPVWWKFSTFPDSSEYGRLKVMKEQTN